MNGKLSFPLGSPQLRKVEARGSEEGWRGDLECLTQPFTCQAPDLGWCLDGCVGAWP